MKKALGVLGLVCLLNTLSAGQVEIELVDTNAVRLDWEAIPGQRYEVHNSPDLLTGAWSNFTPDGIVAESVLGTFADVITNSRQFYCVVKQDTDAPTITIFPEDNAIAVPTNSPITIIFADETGVDASSIHVSVGPWADFSASDPNVSYSSNTLVFTPPESIGLPGDYITNSLTVADTLGHALTNYIWSFRLEQTATTTSDFLPLMAPPAGSAAAKRLPPGVPSTRLRTLPNVRPLSGAEEYHIVSVTSNTVAFSYISNLPAVSNGTLLVSFDAAFPFYRRVDSDDVIVNISKKTVTVSTVDIPVTDLISDASLTSIQLSPADPAPASPKVEIGLNLLHAEFGDDLSETVLYSDANLKLWLPECTWSFVVDVDAAADIGWGELKSFDASAKGELTIHIKPEALFYAAISGEDEFPLMEPVTKIFGGMAGPVPVWVEVIVELNAGYEYDASVAGNAHTVVDVDKELTFSVQLRQNQWTYGVKNPPIVLEAEPISWQLEGNAHAKVYVQPKLTILAYSLAGLWADVVPYTELEGQYQFNPLKYDWALYFGLTSTLGIESRIWYEGWGEKPEWSLYNERWPLWTTNYPPASSAPLFSATFPDRTVQLSKSMTLSGYASGIPDPQYKWYFNGSRIASATAPEYVIAAAQTNHAGTYAVQAYNSAGSVQTSCLVTISGTMPAGMTLVTAGTFQMGDSFAEGDADELPTHAIYTSAYCIDKYEVSKTKWDEVYLWAINNGYDFDNEASGKAESHPVYFVSWYDAVKWCNARSEKEKLTPAYYMSSAKTQVYRTGRVNVSNNWVRWTAGYRLPTEAEWEKAARSGVSGRRFPWTSADTIMQTQANYNSRTNYSYDVNLTEGYHPAYTNGGSPYTSPGGSFLPNGYGLYDMAGNIREWCWDCYSGSYYGVSPTINPHGPETTTGNYNRVLRGGSWASNAKSCRVADRLSYTPVNHASDFGFRTVLPISQ